MGLLTAAKLKHCKKCEALYKLTIKYGMIYTYRKIYIGHFADTIVYVLYNEIKTIRKKIDLIVIIFNNL